MVLLLNEVVWFVEVIIIFIFLVVVFVKWCFFLVISVIMFFVFKYFGVFWKVLSSVLIRGVFIIVFLLKFIIVRFVVIFCWLGNYCMSVEIGEI